MSWHYSRALVEEYSAEHYSGGVLCAQSSCASTRGVFLSQDKTMDACDHFQFGTTSEHSMESRGEELLISFLEDFRAKTSPRPEEQTAMESTASKADSGKRWRESFARYDRDSHSWKTAQLLLTGGLELFLQTWPRWGLMRDGACFPLPMLAHLTDAKGCGLSQVIGTPIKTQRSRGADFIDGRAKNPYEIASEIGMLPHPKWCEALMMWPIGWTDMQQLETDKFQQWQLWHLERLRDA